VTSERSCDSGDNNPDEEGLANYERKNHVPSPPAVTSCPTRWNCRQLKSAG